MITINNFGDRVTQSIRDQLKNEVWLPFFSLFPQIQVIRWGQSPYKWDDDGCSAYRSEYVFFAQPLSEVINVNVDEDDPLSLGDLNNLAETLEQIEFAQQFHGFWWSENMTAIMILAYGEGTYVNVTREGVEISGEYGYDY